MNNEKIKSLFKKVNIPNNILESFLKDNEELVSSIPDIEEHLFFITKGELVYGIVYIDGDFYKWSVLGPNGFTPFKEYTDDDYEFLSTCDYIVELVLGYPLSKDVQEQVPGIEELTLEEQIKKLCKINFNSGSYNIQ